MLKHCYHKYDDNTIAIYGGTNLRAQSFTPTVTLTCTGLTVFLSKLGTPAGTLTYSLYLADGSGNPTGAALATATPSYSNLDTSYPGQPLRGVFSPVVLTSGVQYVFTLNLNAGNSSNCLRITYKQVGDYSGGNDKLSTDGGANWIDTAGDLMFDLWDGGIAGINRYYTLMQITSAVRLVTIYRDSNFSTIEASFKVGTNTTAAYLLKSVDYLYAVTFTNAASTLIYRYNPDLTLDTTWAVSGILTISGNCYYASVSQDDWLLVSTATTLLRGYLYQYNNTGTQVWTIDGGINGNYLSGAEIANTADFISLVGPSWGWTSIKRSDKSALATYTAGNWAKTAVRNSNLNVFGVSGTQVQEYPSAGGAAIWTRSPLVPTNGAVNHIRHIPDASPVDLLILGAARANNNSMYELNGSTGGIIATFDTGAAVNRIELDSDGNLLVCGVSGSDGVGTTTFRQMDQSLSVLWRFDENFVGTLVGAVVDFASSPSIETESTGGTFEPGDMVNLYVTASGTEPLSYQWYKDDSPIEGATLSTYSFTAAKTSAGTYYCIVTNDYGNDQSSDMVLVVQYAPEITSQSGTTIALVGVHTTLFIVTDALPSATYRWYKDGNLIPGAIVSTYEFFATYQDAGTYTCVASNVVGDMESAAIMVTVIQNPYHYSAFNRQIDQDRS